jgi:putative membrane protein
MRTALKYSAILASVVLLWTYSAAWAAQAAGTSTTHTFTAKTKTTMHMMSDATFAKAAAEGGFAEVNFGRLAEDKGTNQKVKDFGKRMVHDHSKAEDNLKSVVAKDDALGVSIPMQLNASDQATYDQLSKLSGSAFDRAYAQDMVKDHVNDVAAFRREANSGKDASVKSFAAETLPTLEDHLKQAREMLHSVTASTGESAKKQKS